LRLLRRNLLGVYGVYAASIASGFVVTPVVLHGIGQEQFGVWAFIGSLTIYLALLDVGVGPSIVRFGAEYRGRRSPAEMNSLASTGLAIYGVVGLLTIPLGLGLAYVAPLLVDVPESLVWSTRVATGLLVLSLVLRFPLGLFSNLLVAQQRWDVANLGNAVSTVFYAVAVVLLLPRTGGIVLLAALTLAATLLRLGLPLLWVRAELPELRLRRSLVTWRRARQLLAASWQNFLLHVAAKVVFSADLIIVGMVLGAAAAALYALPAKLFALAFGLATAGTNLLYPAFAELEGADDHERQATLLRSGLRAGGALTLMLALPLLLVPDQLLRGWVGPGYDESAPVLAILGGVLLVHQPVSLLAQFLIARGLNQRLAFVLLATVTVNVVLSVVLASAVGIWGVALSTLVTDVVALAYVAPALAAPAAGLPIRTLLRDLLRPVLPALAAAAVVLLGVWRAFDVETWRELLPLGLLWVAVMGLALWRFGLSKEDRSVFARMAGHSSAPPAAQFADEL
jgi:O-antigen/teichoic acid export membrane protein